MVGNLGGISFGEAVAANTGEDNLNRCRQVDLMPNGDNKWVGTRFAAYCHTNCLAFMDERCRITGVLAEVFKLPNQH